MNKSVGMTQRTQPALDKDVTMIEQVSDGHAITRVAAYCRVSTDMEIQQSSLDTQIAAYNKVITERPGWVLAGIYADKGISGTSVKHREEFKRMIEDAKAGKINYIIAKSISRFARNTVDTLAYVRELKSYGVSVFFEKEKLDTGNAVSEFLLSIFAAAAQEEIISLSNNMKVGRRMRYASGIAQWTKLYGFRKGPNNEHVIEESEAEVVRRVFKEYVEGRSQRQICKGLEEDGIPSVTGKPNWQVTNMYRILHNERYAGDLRMQKSYVSDPIQHIRVNNRDAKLKQYYKENHHAAIVDRETFQMAQTISTMKDMHRGTSQYPYYGFLKCPICGERMIRFGLPRNGHTFGWTCGGKTSKKGTLRRQRTACPPYYIVETYIDTAFWNGLRMVSPFELKRIVGSEDQEKSKAAVQMLEFIQRGISKRQKVEYKHLCDLVDQISFPQWSVMKIAWKASMVSEVHIDYNQASDQPYPTITKMAVKQSQDKSEANTVWAYTVNGKPLTKGCPSRQIEAISRTQEEIQELVILEPYPYEADIPRVYGKKTSSDKGGAELSEAKLRKSKTHNITEVESK